MPACRGRAGIADHAPDRRVSAVWKCGEDATGAVAPNGFSLVEARKEPGAHHIMTNGRWRWAKTPAAFSSTVCSKYPPTWHRRFFTAASAMRRARDYSAGHHSPLPAARRGIGKVDRAGLPVGIVPDAAVVSNV